jgi:hypothetical protein
VWSSRDAESGRDKLGYTRNADKIGENSRSSVVFGGPECLQGPGEVWCAIGVSEDCSVLCVCCGRGFVGWGDVE